MIVEDCEIQTTDVKNVEMYINYNSGEWFRMKIHNGKWESKRYSKNEAIDKAIEILTLMKEEK